MANNILKQSLDFLKVKVDTYNGSVTSVVEISNISTLNDGDEFLKSSSPIILSVINIEEDKVAKSPNIYKTNTDDSTTVDKHKNPTQHFITSLLFTAYNKDQTNDKYLDGISKLVSENNYSPDELVALVSRKGGVYSYLGIVEVKELEKMHLEGDEKATEVLDAMIYQIVKEIGALAAVFKGKVDGIILTGGIAFSDLITTFGDWE